VSRCRGTRKNQQVAIGMLDQGGGNVRSNVAGQILGPVLSFRKTKGNKSGSRGCLRTGGNLLEQEGRPIRGRLPTRESRERDDPCVDEADETDQKSFGGHVARLGSNRLDFSCSR